MFLRPTTAISGPFRRLLPISKLAQDGTSHDEAELCVMIRKTGTNIPESEALGYVLGYTASNGVSAPMFQLLHRSVAFQRGSTRVVPSVCDNLDRELTF